MNMVAKFSGVFGKSESCWKDFPNNKIPTSHFFVALLCALVFWRAWNVSDMFKHNRKFKYEEQQFCLWWYVQMLHYMHFRSIPKHFGCQNFFCTSASLPITICASRQATVEKERKRYRESLAVLSTRVWWFCMYSLV